MSLVLLCTWVALAVVPPLLWHRKTGAWKRRVAPWWMVVLGVYAALLVPVLTGGAVALVFAAPVIALLTGSTIKGTRYCDICGAMVISVRWWSPPDRCPRCGANLALVRRSGGE